MLIGEIFDEASSWLEGDQFDTVLNYPMKEFINDLFAYRSIDVEIFKMRINSYVMQFNKNVLNSMVNIISTHDTPRFLTLCGGDERDLNWQWCFNLLSGSSACLLWGRGWHGRGNRPRLQKPHGLG